MIRTRRASSGVLVTGPLSLCGFAAGPASRRARAGRVRRASPGGPRSPGGSYASRFALSPPPSARLVVSLGLRLSRSGSGACASLGPGPVPPACWPPLRAGRAGRPLAPRPAPGSASAPRRAAASRAARAGPAGPPAPPPAGGSASAQARGVAPRARSRCVHLGHLWRAAEPTRTRPFSCYSTFDLRGAVTTEPKHLRGNVPSAHEHHFPCKVSPLPAPASARARQHMPYAGSARACALGYTEAWPRS